MVKTAAAAPDADPEDQSEAGEGSKGGADLSQGYVIEISVLPDGTFNVGDPEPLAEEQEEEKGGNDEGAGQNCSDIGDALKAVIAIVQANPVGSGEGGPSAQEQMQAGYGQG